ncbi:hypothetical protein BO70DRAFT_45444 [Aspergillus heteromorphus CBS 117.55]|uniref:Uncharacterized protein n=1 Tax=Aspergillus heteromorphus CBS 117.55 TaxID=1448321 RepID=A0A317W1U1_9EURO|nr:uncharacterized protein BO70DRAFT_45444 [Aspergillus heteromorphus CBS 117.55]PWY80544.1 hypothetical protein BO70DRAFT_45444 [Aspergillus heteromorphus CBS 117.55]
MRDLLLCTSSSAVRSTRPSRGNPRITATIYTPLLRNNLSTERLGTECFVQHPPYSVASLHKLKNRLPSKQMDPPVAAGKTRKVNRSFLSIPSQNTSYKNPSPISHTPSPGASFHTTRTTWSPHSYTRTWHHPQPSRHRLPEGRPAGGYVVGTQPDPTRRRSSGVKLGTSASLTHPS